AKIDRLARHRRVAQPPRPLERSQTHRRAGERQLDAAILERADVLELRTGEALGRRVIHTDEGVDRLRAVEGRLETETILERGEIEADFHLAGALGSEIGIA